MLVNIVKRIKMFFYRCRCWIKNNRIGRGTFIYKGCMLHDCSIGDYVHVGPNCIFNMTTIGNYSSIAPHVQIGGMEHPYQEFSTSTFLSSNSKRCLTEIGNDVWIAAGSIIKTGVKIGNGAVIGANSFVNKDVPPYAIVIGTPAKLYKYRFDDQTIAELERSRYWEQKPSKARQVLLEIKSNSTI
ncbi:MAG: CatB-related O-acetyltransferase [Bacteroidales bacterium]|nr:CatB-related O-acetyltransferase [Bacteroidales bacterium]